MLSEKMVLVGRQSLFLGTVKASDPIKFGEVLDLEGDALVKAKEATYTDALGVDRPMFEPASSLLARRAISRATGRPMEEHEGDAPATRPRARRAAKA